MATFKVFKETALPATLQAHAMYLIAPTGSTEYVELYVTDSVGKARRHFNEADVRSLVTEFMQGVGHLAVVNTIAERDAIQNPLPGSEVIVLDATGDNTVTSGGARYLRQGTNWVKTAETESMDLVLRWENVVGKPKSSVAAIDEAVAAKHTHTNKSQLDKIGEDSDGNVTYGGKPVKTAWDSVGW